MGNGCLKPTPRTGEIYIDCINKIYDEVKAIQYNQEKYLSFMIRERNSADLYLSIKQLLQKKGWLRKLMDNLTSHRQSISQAALHNFRLMAQSKGKEYKVTGLVVIDYIIGGVLRQSGLEMNDKLGGLVLKMIKDKEVNATSQYQDSQPYNTNGLKKEGKYNGDKDESNGNFIKPLIGNTNSQASLKYFDHISPNQNSKSLINNRSNSIISNLLIGNSTSNSKTNTSMNILLLREIYNVKFSNIFYNMLHSLISTEDSIYLSAVNSIISYTRYHTVKNIQQEKITDLLQILLQHIQTGEEVNLSLKAYEMLLQKLRQTFLENQIKHFKIFLKIWQQSSHETCNQQVQNIHKHLENRLLLQSIIHKMIVSMIGSVGINKIYEQIISVYDQHRFERMQHFEEMLINITRKDELKKQFYRGLYSFLLSYLAVCKGEVHQSLKSIGSIKQFQTQLNNNLGNLSSQKWACIHSSKSYQSFISQYENIGQQRIKKEAIETLKRWSREYRFVEINEIIKYNSQLVLNSFLFNIHECFARVGESNSNIGVNDGNGVNDTNIGSKGNSIVPSLVLQRKKLPPIVLATTTNKPLTQSTQSTQSFPMAMQFAKYLSEEFCNEFCHHAQLQQRIAIINLLYDEIRGGDVSDAQKVLYLEMVEKLLYEEWLEETSKTIDWCQIDICYSKNIIVKLIALVITIVNKFTQKMLIKQLDHLAYFLYSLFDLLTRTDVKHHQVIEILNASIKLIQTIERSNGSLIILSFTQRMIKAVTNDMDKNNFFYTWDFIVNSVYSLLISPRNFNRQQTKTHLNHVYIQMTINQQLKANAFKFTQQEIQQKIVKILLDTFGQLDDNQIQGQFLQIHLPKSEDFENHHHLTGSHQKIYELSSIAFRDMFSRGVSLAKGGFFPPLEEQTSFTEQNGAGFSRVHSIIHEDQLRHEEKSIADVMDMIRY